MSESAQPIKKNGFFQSDLWWMFSRDLIAVASFVIFAVIAIAALTAPLTAPTNPYDLASIDVMDSQIGPSWSDEGDERFLLGTDDQGRDLFSTILYGARVSLIIGILAVIVQAFIGVSLGLLAGYYGGWADNILMRLADVQLSFSTMLVAIIALAVVKTLLTGDAAQAYSQWAIVILVLVIGIAEWPQYARTIRASVLAEKEKEYVEAAKVMGFGARRIMLVHILPNCLSPIVVISTVQVAHAIMAEAALSFLGLGMPVERPSLGGLIRSGYEYIFSGEWWITFFPGLVLVLLVLAINLLGDWLRDALNPRLVK